MTTTNAVRLAGAGAAVAATLLLAPGTASAGHADCALTLHGPALDYGIYAGTSGSVDCGSVKNTIRFSIVLTRDGAVVDSSERTCHKAASCWSYLLENDSPGDQVWCARISARVGPHTVGTLARCEEDPAF